jgi:hypothetical protein
MADSRDANVAIHHVVPNQVTHIGASAIASPDVNVSARIGLN